MLLRSRENARCIIKIVKIRKKLEVTFLLKLIRNNVCKSRLVHEHVWVRSQSFQQNWKFYVLYFQGPDSKHFKQGHSSAIIVQKQSQMIREQISNGCVLVKPY